MAELQPEPSRILGTIIRELEQTIIPELSSAHSQTVAHLINQGLRNLLTQKTTVPALLETWTNAEADLLKSSGSQLPDTSKLDTVEKNHLLGEQLQALVAKQNINSDSKLTSPLIRKAITAEHDFYAAHQQAIDTIVPPQRSNESQALLDFSKERLTTYFSKKFPQINTLEVTDIQPILSGFSKETTLVDIQADGSPMPLVIRRNITYGAVDSRVEDEYPIIEALFKKGLAVPEPILLESDTRIFGEAFNVTRRAPGAAACNSMDGLTVGPELKNAALELAAFLGQLHSLDLNDLSLPQSFYNPALSANVYLEKELDICEKYNANHSRHPSPTITAALKWLRANIPDVTAQPRLVHGDAALANIMMHDEKISVMLDWELAHPGDSVEDVTYARKWVGQVMPWEEFLAHYKAHGGAEYAPEREKFYALLSDVRVAMFTLRTQDMFAKGDHPSLTQMYGAQHYYGHFIRQVAQNLLAED